MSVPPLVSVWVGCYNHAAYVTKALDSVRYQSYSNIQLIIWDDCSRDSSVATIREWITGSGIDCTFLEHSENYGICRSFNEALGLSRGKYIAVVSADDIWLPEKLASQVAIMEELPDSYGVVYSDAYRIDESGRDLPGRFIETYRPLAEPPQGWIFNSLIEGDCVPAMATLVRAKCFDVVGNYDESLCFEDWDMWIRIAREFQFAYQTEPTAKYRILQTSMLQSRSKDMEVSIRKMWIKYLKNGWLDTNQSAEAIHRLLQEAAVLYRNRDNEALSIAVNLLRFRPNALILLMVLCIATGLPSHVYDRLASFGVFCKKIARPPR